MMFIYDRDYNQVRVLDVDYTLTHAIGKVRKLNFESTVEIPKGYYIVVQKEDKYYEFVVVDADYSRSGTYIHRYHCQDTVTELQGYYIEEDRPKLNHREHIANILKGTQWTLSTTTNYGDTKPKQMYHFRKNVFETFKKIIDKYELEWYTQFEFSENKITKREIVINKLGKKTNSRLEFEKNIVNFTRRILPEPVYTALVGLGKEIQEEGESKWKAETALRRLDFKDINNGLMYVENLEAKEKYGIGEKGKKQHFTGVVIFNDEEDSKVLLQRTKDELEILSKPRAEYEIDVANLNIDVTLGDEVPAIDDVIDFRNYLRVIKIEETARQKLLTFGVITQGFSSVNAIRMEEMKESVNVTLVTAMESVMNELSQKYLNEDGYTYNLEIGNEYGLPAGIYSFNKPIDQDPTSVVYVGAGKVLIADSKGTDGAWQWKTAMTGEGLVGSNIIANSITVQQLASDVGQSLDLSSNVSITSIVKNEWEKNSNIVKLDSKMVPIVPYKKGDIWYKDKYNFTQGYDIIKATDTVTLDEFAESGLFRAKVDSLGGTFEWNDWERVSADSQSQYTQLSNMIATTVKQADLLTTINQQAGNILLKASADGKSSKLNLTANGTEIENALIKDAHISTLNVSKIIGDVATFVKTSWNAINSSINIDGTKLVASHTDGTRTMLDATGLYTEVGGTKYRHSYLTYASSYLKLNAPVTAPVWVTLPPIWKGRKFDVLVSLASTAGMNELGNESVIRNISVGHLGNTKDYVNGRFQLYGICEYYNTATKARGTTWVDVRYLVQQKF